MAAPTIDPDTTPLYYLVNFRYLINFVTQRYKALLDDREIGFLRQFGQLSEPAQALYVRLTERKGPYFRVDKLSYAEIPRMQGSLIELCEQGFAIVSGLNQVHVQLAVRTKVELVEITRAAQLKPAQMNRDQLIALIIESGAAVPLLEVIRLGYLDILDRLYLLFFGNSNQNLNELVLHEIGVMRYEDYTIDSSNLFSRRADIDDALCLNRIKRLAKRLGAEIRQATRKPKQTGSACEVVAPEFLADLSSQLDKLIQILPSRPAALFLSYQFDRLLLSLAGYCERLSKLESACQLYQLARLPPCREKLARLYLKTKDLAALRQLCMAMLTDPKTEAEITFAEKKLTQLANTKAVKQKVGKSSGLASALLGFRTVIQPGNKLMSGSGDQFETRHTQGQESQLGQGTGAKYDIKKETIRLKLSNQERIEAQVIAWYRAQGKSAQFVENDLFTGLLGLTCWDIIFESVPGAFFHPFQRGPADLYNGNFRSQREPAFKNRFEQIRAKGQLEERITACFQRKYGRINPFVHWRRLELADYCRFVGMIEPTILIRVFQRMLDDPLHHCSGFPDLLVWNDDQYELVEVKGPGDRLQGHQRRWQAYFSQIGLPALVLYVSDVGQENRGSTGSGLAQKSGLA